MKLEPFQRGMKELAPDGLDHRVAQSAEPEPRRSGYRFRRHNFGTLKVSPVFYWSDADMEAYLEQHQSAQRVGLFRSGQSRRKARVRPARRLGQAKPWRLINRVNPA